MLAALGYAVADVLRPLARLAGKASLDRDRQGEVALKAQGRGQPVGPADQVARAGEPLLGDEDPEEERRRGLAPPESLVLVVMERKGSC